MFGLDDSASRLLERFGQLSETFRGIAATLEARPDVRSTRSAFDVRSYPNGTVAEVFAEAEFQSDTALVWWLDLWWRSGQWVAEAQVLRTESGGQVAVREYEPVTALSFELLEPGVEQLVRHLKASADDAATLLAAAAAT